MARALLKIQRYFRRKPVRFFSFILLYLTAGSLVFLHSGFSGDSAQVGREPLALAENGASTSEGRGLGLIGRVFKDTRRAARRFRPKGNGQDGPAWAGAGGRSRAAKERRSTKEIEDGRGKTRLFAVTIFILQVFFILNKARQKIRI
uniref:Uncharacterized protein n=1 Tax=Astyanax mexicanus TaxID=7994 RepID=A0A8B9GZC3_ASTMX